MIAYVAHRLASLIVVMALVGVCVFLLLHLEPGDPAAIIAGDSSGIEIGWGAGVGTESYAMQQGQWHGGDDADSVPSPAGKDFSALIAELGGPPGKIEG